MIKNMLRESEKKHSNIYDFFRIFSASPSRASPPPLTHAQPTNPPKVTPIQDAAVPYCRPRTPPPTSTHPSNTRTARAPMSRNRSPRPPTYTRPSIIEVVKIPPHMLLFTPKTRVADH